MTEFLTAADLASYLGVPESATLERIVTMTNALITDEWLNPTDPIPASVTSLAWTVAIRAGANPKGLTSWTRSWDDISRTERMEGSRLAGVYLTDDELAALNGGSATIRKAKSIQMRVPGWC